MPRYFTVQDEVTRHNMSFNDEGTELTMKMTALPASAVVRDPAQYFASSVDKLFEYFLRDLHPRIMVGIAIHNADNQQDRQMRMSLRRVDQISRDVP
jgi:hypothetical protein